MFFTCDIIERQLGVVPSLEVLPFFANRGEAQNRTNPVRFQPRCFPSYGEIVRGLLRKDLAAGVLPWEVFVLDILSRPGQRDQWQVPLFLNPCPTELVLRESLCRILFPQRSGAGRKFPTTLVLGIESEHSLTKQQFSEWISQWPDSKNIKIHYKVLPLNLMAKALKAETIDALIAPSPWGLRENGEGMSAVDLRFRPGRFAQKLAFVCQRECLKHSEAGISGLEQVVSSARVDLRNSVSFGRAVAEMACGGHSGLSDCLLERARRLHRFASLDRDARTSELNLTTELRRLAEIGILPSQISPGEQTARLLLPS